MIDLLYPVHYEQFDPHAPSGEKNPGGGMATKMLSVREVLSRRYIVNIAKNFDTITSNIVVIEPLTPRLMQQDISDWIAALKACKAKKILFCSEMEVSRWSPNTFAEIMAAVDVVTANTAYQTAMIQTLSGGEIEPMYLCDPIDESLFQPLYPKRTRIFGAGRISRFKNSQFHVELFRAVKSAFTDRIETAYFGSANLWGPSHREDHEIAEALKSTVDVFQGGMSRQAVSKRFGESLIYASKTEHDVYSSTHVEILGTECISVGGGHPMFEERPGFAGLKTLDDFLAVIEMLLSCSEAELAVMQKESRAYMLQHCSFDAFLRQFDKVIQEVL